MEVGGGSGWWMEGWDDLHFLSVIDLHFLIEALSYLYLLIFVRVTVGSLANFLSCGRQAGGFLNATLS